MQIIARDSHIYIKDLYRETRTVNGLPAQTIKIMLDGPILADQLAAIAAGNIEVVEDGKPVETIIGYTHAHEHYLVLAKPPISQAEAEDMREALESMGVQKGKTWTEGAEATRDIITKPDLDRI